MALYPDGYDELVNPGATDKLNTPGVFLDVLLGASNDAIEAIQQTVGLQPQGEYATVAERLEALASAIAGFGQSISDVTELAGIFDTAATRAEGDTWLWDATNEVWTPDPPPGGSADLPSGIRVEAFYDTGQTRWEYPDGTQASDTLRPTGALVTYWGGPDPDALGLMLDGDVWHSLV